MTKRKILVTLESRATYGYSKNVMLAMREFPELELATLVTGMHLIPELGYSIDLIKSDGFPVNAQVPLASIDSSSGAWARAIGGAIPGFADAIERLSPDIILLSGDRAETFAITITGSYMGIPMAHIQAGDKSGHVDDLARMAMAKLCQIHLASCEDSVNRLRKLGEEEFRIFNVGAPQLDDIVNTKFTTDNFKIQGAFYDLAQPYLLVVQHPVMAERHAAGDQIENTIRAALAIGIPVFLIYPNSDLGFKPILKVISGWQDADHFTALSNLSRTDYLTLLANCSVLLGNSSSGILEAPSFGVPVVNIGNRQRGRPQAKNILNCGYSFDEIAKALHHAINDEMFREMARTAVNPFGDGASSERICEVLSTISLDQKLLDKQTTY